MPDMTPAPYPCFSLCKIHRFPAQDINTITDRITAFTDFDAAAFDSCKLDAHPQYRHIHPSYLIKSGNINLSLNKANQKIL